MNRPFHLRKDLGQTTVHYAGIGLLVITLIALVLASTTTDIGQRVICTINSAVSQVGGGPSLSCGSSATTPDLQVQPAKAKSDSKEPDSCTTSTKTAYSGGHVKIGFIKFGNSFALAEQEEKYVDPKTGEVKTRYSVVATDGATLGGEVGVGTKGEVNGSGLGADLSAEAGFDVKAGDTWEFNSKEEMETFVNHYESYRIQRQQLSSDNSQSYVIYLALTGGFIDPPRKADKSSISGGISTKVKADAGLRAGTDGDGKKSVNLNTGIYAKAQADKNYTSQKDNRKGHEGEHTDTVKYSGSISGGANAVFWGLSGTGSYEGGMSTTYDKNNKLTEITFTQQTSGDVTWNTTNGPVKGNGDATGSGSASSTDKKTHVTTTKLKVTDENRAIVNEWLSHAYVTDPRSGETTLTIPPNVLNPDSPVSSDPMQQLLYDQAVSTDSVYNVDGNEISIGGEIALGLKIGGEVSVGDEKSKINQQTYLGSPASSGGNRARKVVDWCK